MEEKQSGLSYSVAILIAGVCIAGAIVYASSAKGARAPVGGSGDVAAVASAVPVMPIGERDHVLGNKDAPVFVIEFSDTECPFCKSIHATLEQLIAESDGQVAWVYRHAPIAGLHDKAQKEGEAAECAADLGGEEMFWKYLDELFAVTPSNDGLDLSLLPQFAEKLGIDKAKFDECLASGKFKDRVESDLMDALASGPGSTPWSVVMSRDGKVQFPISGAMPISVWRQVVKAVQARGV